MWTRAQLLKTTIYLCKHLEETNMVAQEDKWKQTQTSEIGVEYFYIFWIELSYGVWGQKVDKQNRSNPVPTPGGKKTCCLSLHPRQKKGNK